MTVHSYLIGACWREMAVDRLEKRASKGRIFLLGKHLAVGLGIAFSVLALSDLGD